MPVGNNKYGYIDETGKYLIKPRYDYCGGFNKYGLAFVYDNFNNESFFINIKGDTVIRGNEGYSIIDPFFPHGFYANYVEGKLIVKKNKKYGFIDIKGNIVIPLEYDTINNFNEDHCFGKIINAYFVVNASGNRTLINYHDIDHIGILNEGLAPIKIDGKHGFIDSLGNMKIEPQYLSVGFFNNGICNVKTMNDNWGYIDKTGNWFVLPTLLEAHPFWHNNKFAIAINKNDFSTVLIDTKGRKNKLEDKINSLFDFTNGLAKASKEGNLLYGFINENLDWIIVPQYKWAGDFSNEYCVATKNNRVFGYIDKNGWWKLEPKYTQADVFLKIEEKYMIK
jgi:hypothetical protein